MNAFTRAKTSSRDDIARSRSICVSNGRTRLRTTAQRKTVQKSAVLDKIENVDEFASNYESDRNQAIVVGAGVGGLAIASRLASKGYSRNQLSYLFNQVFEESFYSYINAARVNYFIDLIKSDMSANIADIAADSGFNSMTTFYKFFKQKTGLTPKVYIKQLANAQD